MIFPTFLSEPEKKPQDPKVSAVHLWILKQSHVVLKRETLQ